jgi:ATP-binding cassette subfamily F protein 3
MQYFAQDEANRLQPDLTVYETMESDSPVGMVPMIRNILGGFLFSGDDIYKKAGVLSGGERTRLAVARMLLRPANTLLLDEPTNHLDLDSKDVLLEALADFGGTLIFVSHDRYFVDRLATKIIAVGHGSIEAYPGTYEQFLWSRTQRTAQPERKPASTPPSRSGNPATPPASAKGSPDPKAAKAASASPQTYEQKKRLDAETRRSKKADDERNRRITELESRISEREQAVKELEAQMAAPGFYDNRERSQAVLTKHHGLMWEVGDLMNQWEALQESEKPA